MTAYSGKLKVTLRPWGANQSLYRIHPETYGSLEFNSTGSGDTRFSPLADARGAIIPTLYAGSTLDCALMETVFHDVPFVPGTKLHSKAKHLAGKVRSTFRLTRSLRLIDLTAIPLRRLGVSPSNLVHTDASRYAETRSWALALHQQCVEAEGLLWTSRQDDTASAVMLFGDRVPVPPAGNVTDPEPLLLPDGAACTEVQSLAIRLDLLLV